MASTVKLAEYLFTRLRQLGVESIHGVPGDYNLTLLDYVEPSGIHWVGNCNELNAGYAADGYARIKGIGALITTFGVGDLSAANAIAGAFAELAPVIHIVGTPQRHLQESRALIHHTFNDGDYRRFAKVAENITVAQANLWDPRTATQLIDATIQQCLLHSRPVYIEVPVDMVDVAVSAEGLKTRLEIPIAIANKEKEAALNFILDRMYASHRPMILVDGESRPYGILEELHKLAKVTGWPTWTTAFGKSCMDESLPNFNGIWKGSFAKQRDAEYINSSDLVLCFGPHFSSTNTYAYSSIPDSSVTILFKAQSVETGKQSWRDLAAKHIISALLEKLDPSRIFKPTTSSNLSNGTSRKSAQDPNGFLTQEFFYRELDPLLQPGDIILAETGTAGHGCRDFRLPPHTYLFKPVTWLSIGYMLPATQGAALAQRELHKSGKLHLGDKQTHPRTILLIGDGSFQMTVQELSTIIREKLNVLIILINNDGYTIERCLHGWNQRYNDVASWRYLQAPAFFGASQDKDAEYRSQTSQVKTWSELDKMIETESEVANPRLSMVEVFMPREDAPEVLAKFLKETKEAEQKKV